MSPKLNHRFHQKSFARGMNDGAEVDSFRPDEVAAMYNARVSYDGDAGQRRKGSKRMHATTLNSGATITGAVEFYDKDSVRYLVVVAGSIAYSSTDDGASWTQLATGLGGGGWDFTIMQSGADRFLIGVNGAGAPQKCDGATWTALTGTSIPTNAQVCEYHNNRLWLWGHSTNLMIGSVVDDPTDFSSANGAVTVRIEITQGDPLPRGLWSQGPALLAMSYEQVGFVEGWGLNTIQVLTGHRGLSRSIGCVGHRTIAQVSETAVIWLSRLGFVYMEQGGQPELISGQIQNFMDALAWDNIAGDPDLPSGCWYPRKHEYHCAVPAAGNSQNTHTVVVRPKRLGRPLAVWINRAEATTGDNFLITDGVLELSGGGDRAPTVKAGVFELLASGVPGLAAGIVAGVLEFITNDFVASVMFAADDAGENLDGELWSGAYDGFVRRLEHGDLDDLLSDDTGGTTVNAWIRTRPQTAGDQYRRKRLRQARVALKAESGGSIDVYPVADGTVGSSKTETLTTQEATQVAKSRVSGKGYALSTDLRFTDDISVQGVELGVEILRERP